MRLDKKNLTEEQVELSKRLVTKIMDLLTESQSTLVSYQINDYGGLVSESTTVRVNEKTTINISITNDR